MTRFKALAVMVGVVVAGLAPVSAHADTSASTWVVDRDGLECGNADFTSIQAAVDAAQPGDVIRVCPDLYAETVIVDKTLTLTGDPDAVEAVDCFQPTPSQPGDADPARHVIVDPAGDGFTIAVRLQADDIVLAGFVVQGASVGIDASDRFSGYGVHHNLIRLNSLFGVDFGSDGTRESRVDHNCIRENRFGLVSELDDDSLWKSSDGPERDAWNARDLINARINYNSTRDNRGGGLEAAGPGRRVQVTIDHNVSRDAILLQNSTDSAVVHNELVDTPGNAIIVGGGNARLLIGANRVDGAGGRGIFFVETFIDRFPIPSRNVVVTHNDVRNAQAGIVPGQGNLADSLIAENTTSENRVNGIALFGGNTGNVVRGNHADNNGVNGIIALLGATGNRFEQNSMHGNTGFDARDLNPLGSNVWINNDCEHDSPDGICGIG